MRFAEFAARMDEIFTLERYAEPDGWDFALSAADRGALRRLGSAQFVRTFNGFVGASDVDQRAVRRVYLAVFPERGLLDRVIDRERGGDGGAIVLTHHPVDMETSGRGFLAIPPAQLAGLLDVSAALYVLHAPLDCHETISTSRALAAGLGLAVERTFAPYIGGDCGVIGVQAAEPFAAFAERIRLLCELPSYRPDQIRFTGCDVSRVAIVAGGGDDAGYLEQAQALGCDTYLAGHWWTPHAGEWCDRNRAAIRALLRRIEMNLLSASHDGSELVVFRDKLQPMIENWDIETVLLRQQDHWR